MKKQVLALLGGVLLLSACSSDNSGGGPSINVLAKPGNPASQASISELFQTVKESNAYLPSDEALFSQVIDGTKTKYVGTDDKAEALKKLNTSGRQFVDKIKSTCTLKNATSTESGTATQGDTKIYQLTLSSTGSQCGYEMEKSNIQSTYFSRVETDHVSKSRVTATLHQVNTQKIVIRDEKIKQASNLAQINIKVIMDITGDSIKTTSNETADARGTISGEVSIQFANGETLQGPLEGVFSMTKNDGEQKNELYARFKGSSPKGDIWFGLQSKDSKTEVYLNGEKINLNDATGPGTIFKGLQSAFVK